MPSTIFILMFIKTTLIKKNKKCAVKAILQFCPFAKGSEGCESSTPFNLRFEIFIQVGKGRWPWIHERFTLYFPSTSHSTLLLKGSSVVTTNY